MKKAILIFGTAFLFLAIFIIALFNAPKGKEFSSLEALQKQSQQKEKDTNKIVFVWEGLEKDIPQDGEFIQITGTDENTVYLNAIDE